MICSLADSAAVGVKLSLDAAYIRRMKRAEANLWRLARRLAALRWSDGREVS